MIAQERILYLFKYKDGMLFWRNVTSNRAKINTRAGSLDRFGNRRVIRADCRGYYEHNIIWIYHFGQIPNGFEIDHRDINSLNNNIDNLRLSTKHQNNCNKNILKRNTTGYKGVWRDKRDGRFYAYINFAHKRKPLGGYNNAIDAAKRYNEEALLIHGEFAKLNVI